MVRILRHNIHRQTLLHIGINTTLVVLLVVLVSSFESASPIVVITGVLFVGCVSTIKWRGLTQRRVLVFGAGPQAMVVGTMLQQTDPRVQVVGCYACLMATPGSAQALPNLYRAGMPLPELVQRERIGEIVIAERAQPGAPMPLCELLACKQSGVRVLDASTHFEQTMGQIHPACASDGWQICEGFEHSRMRRTTKRLFDLLGASLMLLLALPVMALAAVLILLETGGPVLYRQERVGLHGRSFAMLKLRSMCTHAERDAGPQWASASDARVTRLGRFMRKRHIDELPQLINVIRGDMSLVGPRPERPCFVATLAGKLPLYEVRHCVKPGITGWAQVRFRYGASVQDAAEKLQYDLYYVKNQCLLLDLVVLSDTVGAHDREGAIQSLQKALAIQPDFLDAQRALIGLYMLTKHTELALALARKVQAQRTHDDAGYIMEADILASSKEWERASAVLQAGLRQMDTTPLAMKLHTNLQAAGKNQEAERFSTQWQQDHPQDAAFFFYMGDQALARKSYAIAEQYFSRVRTLQPENPMVLNNLAWVGGKLKNEGAIALAEKAVALAPQQATFMDTLAALYSEQGNYMRAVELQNRAIELQPQNPLLKLNLAIIHLRGGNPALGQKSLTELNALGDKFASQPEVQALQQQIARSKAAADKGAGARY